MKTLCSTEGMQTSFILSDVNPAYYDAIRKLFFTPHEYGFAKTYLANTPHQDIFYQHFARTAEEAETNRETCPRQHKGGKPLRKDLSDAVRLVTEEPTHMQDELHTEACAGQICHHASVVAMAACGRAETERTARSHFCRDHPNDQQIIAHTGCCNL